MERRSTAGFLQVTSALMAMAFLAMLAGSVEASSEHAITPVGSAVPKPQASWAVRSAAGWLDAAWAFRREIRIDNGSGEVALADYAVRLQGDLIPLAAAERAGVRFTDADGVTLLDHWVEGGVSGAPAAFWISVPVIPAGLQHSIYVYYGNDRAQSTSNAPQVFLFFDDFEGNRSYPTMFGTMRGKPWNKHDVNPILSKSLVGWDSYGLRDPMLMLDGRGRLATDDGQYVMYYRGNEYDPQFLESGDHIKRQIGRAVSTDGINWIKDQDNNPVLRLGESGSWDDGFIGSAWAIKNGDLDYRLYYDGYDGAKSGIGLATSLDGVRWTKWSENPLLRARDWAGIDDSAAVVAIVSVLKRDRGDYGLFVEVGPPARAIYGALSEDGIHFTPLNEGRALLTGSPGEWDYLQVANPKVVEVSAGKYIMGYNGRGGLMHQLGFATSTDLVHWERYAENPVMFLGRSGAWDGGRVENAFIAKDDLGTDTVRMWFFGCPTTHGVRDCAIGYAVAPQYGTAGPLGWWAVYGAPEASSDRVLSGRTAIRMDGSDRDCIRRFQNHLGSFTVQFHHFYETGHGRASEVRIIDGATVGISMKYEGGHLHYQEGDSWIDLGPVAPREWHKIEIAADTRGNRVAIYIDGVRAGVHRPASATISGLTYLEMVGASGSAYYVEDVSVRNLILPEPTTAVGPEVSMSAWAGVGSVSAWASPSIEIVSPNPASTRLAFRYVLPREGEVRLTVLDAAGRRVRTLLDGHADAGMSTLLWDCRDDGRRVLPSGIYWVLLQCNDGQRVRKLAIVR
ncbi:MAG: DUF2341 domain-containing protein [Candidatus Eisenbacteria bacterium]|nr:DUF2341 domain-containing protein [Candidatus Eisenbacteria bacterium]